MDEMKEVNRQIAMGWKRGYHFGLVIGVAATLIALLLIKIVS